MDKSIILILEKFDQLLLVAGAKIQGFYPYVLQQQYIIAWIGIGAVITSGIVLAGCILYASKKGDNFDPNKGFLDVASIVIGFTAVIICIVAVAIVICDGVPRLINPHYYAVKEVLDMVRTAIPQ